VEARQRADVSGHELFPLGEHRAQRLRPSLRIEGERVQQRASLVRGRNGQAQERAQRGRDVDLAGRAAGAGPDARAGQHERDVEDLLLGPAVTADAHVAVVRGHHQRVPAQVDGGSEAAYRVVGLRGRAPVLVGSATPSVAALVHRVQLDHDERGLAAQLFQERAARLGLPPLTRLVGGEGRGRGIVGVDDRARERGREQPEAVGARGQRRGQALALRHREGVLDAQRPGIVVRGLPVHLLPGAAEHDRASGQRQRGLADVAVVVGAARAQLAEERQAPRSREAEAVHQHHHDLAGQGRARSHVQGRPRERRLVVDEGAQRARGHPARGQAGHHEQDGEHEDGGAAEAVRQERKVNGRRS
jgi:hypothetical protein